jgi:hypothetical protein
MHAPEVKQKEKHPEGCFALSWLYRDEKPGKLSLALIIPSCLLYVALPAASAQMIPSDKQNN